MAPLGSRVLLRSRGQSRQSMLTLYPSQRVHNLEIRPLCYLHFRVCCQRIFSPRCLDSSGAGALPSGAGIVAYGIDGVVTVAVDVTVLSALSSGH